MIPLFRTRSKTSIARPNSAFLSPLKKTFGSACVAIKRPSAFLASGGRRPFGTLGLLLLPQFFERKIYRILIKDKHPDRRHRRKILRHHLSSVRGYSHRFRQVLLAEQDFAAKPRPATNHGRIDDQAATWSGCAPHGGSPYSESPFRQKRTYFNNLPRLHPASDADKRSGHPDI